ncbi:MAG: thioredoxin-disulfide reductase [Candidatus Bathyarchaeota archaeon]|nr:thioredoxin-disulfide reductase [Candidatus Bathyarchaeota archaeon]MDW8040438.1 thioredoxin-disulfide reductase [Nitrososphaerota archaeon]
METWDLIIIGAGPAGLTAGIYAARSGLKALIIEEKIAGGTVGDAPLIENYPGFEKISGVELAQKIAAQCRKLGTTIHEFEKVTALNLEGEEKIVKTDKSAYKAKTVIIASGSSYSELGVPGEKEFRGRGVSYCGICDGPLFKGKRVLVVGGGNSAVATALYLAELASEVKVAHRRDALRAEETRVKALLEKNNVKVLWNTEVKEIKGGKIVEKAILFNNKTGEVSELSIDGVFIQVGEVPNSGFAKEAGVKVDDHGYIIVDTRQRTNILGVYAAGDVTNHPVKQVGTAIGQGITAALEAYGYVKRPYFYKQ